MKIDNLIEIAARLSDVQHLVERGLMQEAHDLLEDTKKELFFRAHDETGGYLSFSEWCKENRLFVNFSKPGR